MGDRSARKTNRTDPQEGAYNGFSLNDRFAAARWASSPRWSDIRPAKVPRGMPCAVCRGTGQGQIGWHNEDYRTPLDPFAVCGWCHWAVHARLKPRQAYVWDRWVGMLADGWTPPPCPWGTRWPTWAAAYLRRDVTDWDWEPPGLFDPMPLTAFTEALTDYRRGLPSVPPVFDLIAGADHMPGQWNAAERAGKLLVFDGFDPPLPD